MMAGDHHAFAAFFDRHFDAVYDFSVRTADDEADAAMAVESAFKRAWDDIHRQRAGENVKAWLYNVARDRSLEAARRARSRPAETASADELPYAVPDPARAAGVQTAAQDEEFAQIVWDAAAGLTLKQYTILDMHIRRGLSADDMAAGLQISRETAYTMLTRLRNALAQSVMYLNLVRKGRRECRELDALLSRYDPTHLTRHIQDLIDKHLRNCERCREKRRRHPSPLEVFRSLALIPANEAIRTRIWQNVSAHTQGLVYQRSAATHRTPAPLTHEDDRSNLPLILAGSGVVLAVLVIIVAALLFFSSGGSSSVSDPGDVRATDREPGDSSTDPTIEVEWTQQEGVQAYSVDWTEGREDVPDEEGDLPGDATGTTSPRLAPGTWFFHLRTQGEDGSWTSTVHVGPFEILEEDRPSPTRTTSPTLTPTSRETPTPVLTPNFGTPPPPPTAAPTPEPTPQPTPEPTAPPPPPTEPPPPPPTATPIPTPTLPTFP
jgi:RNA polymerase sigma factor (sigma-70 family)